MKRLSIILAGAGALLLLLGLLLSLLAGASTMPSYLATWLFWSSLPLGALPVVMLLDLAGPGAGFGLEPILRRMLVLMPLAALLMIPILVRPDALFGWAMGHGFSAPFGKAWMQHGWFIVRSIVYFVLWIVLAVMFIRPPAPESIYRRQGFAAFGLLLYALSASAASVDWAVTVEPAWISAEYPMLLVASQATIAISFALLMAGGPWRRAAPEPAAAFMLAAVAAWIFMQFIQFLVIWSADKSADITWYLHRDNTGSVVAVWIAVVIGFLLPVCALLAPPLRRHRLTLPTIAALMLAVQALAMLWLITPSVRHFFTVSGTDVLELAGIGGLTLGVSLWPISRLEAAQHG